MSKTPDTIDSEGFSEIARNPESWYIKARALERCADALWSSFIAAFSNPDQVHETAGYLETAYLLYGLCLEVAFKGKIIEWHPENAEFGNKEREVVNFPGIGTGGHDLAMLASNAGFSDLLGDATRDDLESLTQCITWLSRYPTPKKVASGGKDPRINLALRDRIKPLIAKVLAHDET